MTDRKYVKDIVEGTPVRQQVELQELDTNKVFGGKTTSTSSNTIAYGVQTYVLDTDDGRVKPGYRVQITSLDDEDCFQLGTVLTKITTVSPAQITVMVTTISPTTNTSSNWEIQITDDNAEDALFVGYSASAVAVGAGDKTFATQTGKAWVPGTYIRAVDVTNNANYMQGVVKTYSAGSMVMRVATQYGGSGSPATWELCQVAPYLELIDSVNNLNGVGVAMQFAAAGLTINNSTANPASSMGIVADTGVVVGTTERDLTVKLNNANRTVDLSGNLTVSSATTVSGTQSGTNTGDQLTNMNQSTVAGRNSSTAGAVQEITLNNKSLSISGTTLSVISGPACYYSATVTPTAITGAATSWDTAAETCTWNTTHGLSTGDTFIPVTNAPGGTTNLSPYYVNALSSTQFALYTSYANALADSSRVNITSSTLTTARKLVFTNINSNQVNNISGVSASTTVGLIIQINPALSTSFPGCFLQGKGLAGGNIMFSGYPTSFNSSTSAVQYSGTNICTADTAGTVSAASTWSAQGTTPFTFTFSLFGT